MIFSLHWTIDYQNIVKGTDWIILWNCPNALETVDKYSWLDYHVQHYCRVADGRGHTWSFNYEILIMKTNGFPCSLSLLFFLNDSTSIIRECAVILFVFRSHIDCNFSSFLPLFYIWQAFRMFLNQQYQISLHIRRDGMKKKWCEINRECRTEIVILMRTLDPLSKIEMSN